MTKTRMKYVPAKIVKSGDDGLSVDVIDRPVRIYGKSRRKDMVEADAERGSRRTVGRKTYVSTCYFEPKHVPVRYSETVFFNIGSKKKTYFESIYNEVKLIPYRWKETMVVDLKPDSDLTEKAEAVIPLEFEYIPIHPLEEEAPVSLINDSN